MVTFFKYFFVGDSVYNQINNSYVAAMTIKSVTPDDTKMNSFLSTGTVEISVTMYRFIAFQLSSTWTIAERRKMLDAVQ